MRKFTLWLCLVLLTLIIPATAGCNNVQPEYPQEPTPQAAIPRATAPDTAIDTRVFENSDASNILETGSDIDSSPDPDGVQNEPIPENAESQSIQAEEPVLSTELKESSQFSEARGDMAKSGLAVGELAVNFTLGDINGTEYRLSRLLASKPVIMQFGSFT